MKKLRDATLVFLVRKSNDKITDICLAMKKRGFGVGRWNGTGGKVEVGKETIEEAARRETREEIGVLIHEMAKVAELSFSFPHNPTWDQMVHVYLSQNWNGDPVESEEMCPKWHSVSEIPYSDMWPDDIFWLPEVVNGSLIRASFAFGEGDTIQEKNVAVVESLA